MPLSSHSLNSAPRRAAREARVRQDWPDLLAQANRMQQESPDEPEGYVWAAMALRHLRLRPALRQMLTQALQRFPDHPQLLAMTAGKRQPGRSATTGVLLERETEPPSALRASAQKAVKNADWREVESLCRRLRVAAPDDPYAYHIGTRALREQRRLGKADLLSQIGLYRFADHSGLLLERAITLHKQKRLEEALGCYDRLRKLQPEIASGYARSASVLGLLGRFDDAETVVQEGLDRFPDDVGLLVQSAITAGRRSDFPRARSLWEEVQRRAPDDQRLARYAGDLTMAEQFHTLPADAEAEPDEAVAEAGAELTDAEVMRRFEGLGGNCEFGLAQRAAGIEPLGLLRFAGITTRELAELLQCGMHEVGSEAQTGLYLNARQEYMLEHRRFFRTHTFINYGETDPAQLLGKLRRRTVFLRDKLLAEVRKGSKICLFRPADGLIDDHEIRALHTALRTLGPAPLICVRNAPDGDIGVKLAAWGDGLFVATMPGHNSKLSLGFVQAHRSVYWLSLCRQALEAVS